MTAPRPDVFRSVRAMEIVLADVRGVADEVEYVNAHASATRLNDPTETKAIEAVLGERAYRVPVSGQKGYYGHPLGAFGRHRGGNHGVDHRPRMGAADIEPSGPRSGFGLCAG